MCRYSSVALTGFVIASLRAAETPPRARPSCDGNRVVGDELVELVDERMLVGSRVVAQRFGRVDDDFGRRGLQ